MPNMLTIFVLVLLTLVILKFAFLIYRKHTTSYQDWRMEQRRLQLREVVQSVRQEMGDYDTSRKGRVPTRKPAATRSRTRRHTR